jgi:hypothetical protein
MLANLEAVHARHHDVEQDQVRHLVVCYLDGRGTVAGRQNVEIFR